MAPAGMTGLGDRGDCALSEAPKGQNGARGLVNGSIGIRFPTRGQGRTDVLQMEISVSSATFEGESWKSFETALIVVWTCFLCYTKLCVEYL